MIDLLKTDPRLVDDEGELLIAAVQDRAWKIDRNLVKLLLSDAEIKANTAVGVRGSLPLVVEFLTDCKPYTTRMMPAQTSHLIIRSHACAG